MNETQAIFVINLQHRADRRMEMQKQLALVGWRAEFFSAVRPEDAGGFPSIGARGCFMSHLGVLKQAQRAGVRQLVILEDDLDFVPGFAQQWQSAMSALEAKTWSIFYPGHVFDTLQRGLSRLAPDRGVRCTHFMVINGEAIQAVVAGLETILSRPPGHPMGGPMHVDGAYSVIRSQNYSLETYAYFPALGRQRPSRTDVGNLKWFDRVQMLQPIVSMARKIKAQS